MWREERLTPEIAVHVRDQMCITRYDRTLLWGDAKTLIICDPQWGNDADLRDGQRPEQRVSDDLSALSSAIWETTANRLIILGDVTHQQSGVSARVREQVRSWHERHVALTCLHVVADPSRSQIPYEWGFNVVPTPHLEGPFAFSHDVRTHPDAFVWAAGRHPTVRVRGAGRRGHTPCFHVTAEYGLLPSFTGLSTGPRINAMPDEKVIALVDGQLLDATIMLAPSRG